MAGRSELNQWLTPEVWRALRARLKLSPRECEIVRGVVEDLSERGMALELGISHHTVHTHLERVYRKLGVASRPQLIRRVMQAYLTLAADPDALLPPVCSRYRQGRCPFRD